MYIVVKHKINATTLGFLHANKKICQKVLKLPNLEHKINLV